MDVYREGRYISPWAYSVNFQPPHFRSYQLTMYPIELFGQFIMPASWKALLEKLLPTFIKVDSLACGC